MMSSDVMGGAQGGAAVNLIFGLPAAVLESAKNLGYTGVGVAASLVSAVTGGKFKQINDWADCTSSSAEILTPLHEYGLKVLRPRDWILDCARGRDENGILSNKILSDFTVDYLLQCGHSDNFYVREIGTRLCFAVKAVASVVTKTFDLTLGVAAGVVSIVPLCARSHAINKFAQEQLQATDVAHTVCRSLIGIVRPAAIYKSLVKS